MRRFEKGDAPNRTASERLTLLALGIQGNKSQAELEQITGTAPRQQQSCIRLLRFANLIEVSQHAADARNNKYSLATKSQNR